jgi:hypothetical protein
MNHFISLPEAETMTAKYRQERNNLLKSEFQNQNILPTCETYDKAAFQTLLNKPDCASIRIYYGMDENFKIHAIIVAVNEDNEDILPSSSLTGASDDLIDSGIRCPELCPPKSPLNSKEL